MRLAKLASIALLLSSIATTALAMAAADGKAAPKKPRKVAVSIHDMAFDPASLDLNVGDSVEWTNNDVSDHTVVARDNSFTSGNLGGGATFRYTFKKAGKFPYGCSLHPRMKGVVNVK